MALSSPPAATLTFNLLDETANTGKTQLHFASTALVADVKTAASALIPLIQAITDCVVVGYTITYAVQETVPDAPIDGARIENKGVFTFTLANTLQTRLEVPGIKEAVLLPSGSIDVENTDVAAFLAAVITSPAIFRGIDGSDIDAIDSAYQRFRRSTRNMLPSDRKKFG